MLINIPLSDFASFRSDCSTDLRTMRVLNRYFFCNILGKGILSVKQHRILHAKSIIILFLFSLLIISIISGILFGSVNISLSEMFSCLLGKDHDSVAYILLTTVRIPRVIGALFAGIGLAASGVILQVVMNNSLASPNTIGVNSGAGFAVMISMLLFPGNIHMVPILAFFGALITTISIFLLAYFADRSRMTIILAGITVSSFLNAGINTMKLLDTDLTINMTSFMIGSLSGVTFSRLILPMILILISLVCSFALSRSLNLLSLGDDIARSLGLSVSLIRFLLLVISSILAGSVISYAGMLSFVGLIVPHICRRLFGNDARFLVPCSALLGGSFVILCDLLGRVLFAPYELPAGILMSFIGGPFFLYLLLNKKGGKRVHA